MQWQAWLTLAVTGAVFGLLIFTRIPPALSLVAAVSLLLICGVIDASQALTGLSNEGMITVAVLFVVGAGVRETGSIDFIAHLILGKPRSNSRAIWRLIVPSAALSGFINNTPLVAMLTPVVIDWAKHNRLAVSKLLIPLSYASILGGTCTLIGTSTNLVVNGWLIKQYGQGLGMFDISWVGVPCAVVGLIYLAVVCPWLLPDRKPAISQLDDPRQYTVEMVVEPNSPLIGQTIEEAGLRHLPGVFLAEIDRKGHVLPAVSPTELLQAGDQLVFVGVVDSVVDLQRTRGLQPATDQVFKLTAPRSTRCLIEAVVSNTCPLVGTTIRDGKFRSRYNAVVLAVARNGERMNKKIGDIVLEPGDTLLLEGHPSFVDQQKNSRDFFLVSQMEDSTPRHYERAATSLVILVGMVLAASFGLMPMLHAALLAAGAMIVTGCITRSAAQRSLDGNVLLAIAAAFGLGAALESTGAARQVAESLIGLAGGSPWIALAVVYAVTLIVTELITNNAAAALMFPLAMATATKLEVNHLPFAVAVMMAASAGFATPIGYQTNLMVYGPGGYRFSDYVKVGVPLDILIGIVTVILAPLVWGFQVHGP